MEHKKLILELIYGLDDIEAVAEQIINSVHRGVITLSGDLGAGKTTITIALAKQLGVIDQVTSPTYAIVNEYVDSSGRAIYHMDLYRIKNEEELLEIGIPDILAQDNWCIVEWPDIADAYLPSNYTHIQIISDDRSQRQLMLYMVSQR